MRLLGLLRLLLSRVVEICAGENVIIINCIIHLLLLVSEFVLLVPIVVHVIELARILVRLVRVHVRRAGCGERVHSGLHHRGTALHLVLIVGVVWCPDRTFLNLLILTLHSLVRLTCRHIEILINM